MQYARRQRAKGRRPLINSAALLVQKAARTDLAGPTAIRGGPPLKSQLF
jgi:hypothetical protein